ncbi:MAG: single-stranded DNA-binding protein [Candidatus Colwellbacteria bacterium]|nr:single-stranded DNA-binding protein [Candidatus Colwellbacteria bacterium]
MNLNKVFLIGNLTRDPELKSLPSGTSVVSFGLATNRVWKNQQGENQQDTQFHNIVAFGKQGETIHQYLTKGSLALVEGRIQTRSWDAQDGSKRYSTEIIAERVQFGPRKSPGAAGGPAPKGKEEMPVIDLNSEEVKPEDLPF